MDHRTRWFSSHRVHFDETSNFHHRNNWFFLHKLQFRPRSSAPRRRSVPSWPPPQTAALAGSLKPRRRGSAGKRLEKWWSVGIWRVKNGGKRWFHRVLFGFHRDFLRITVGFYEDLMGFCKLREQNVGFNQDECDDLGFAHIHIDWWRQTILHQQLDLNP